MRYQVAFYQAGDRQIVTAPTDYQTAQQVAAELTADYLLEGAEFDTDDFDYAVEIASREEPRAMPEEQNQDSRTVYISTSRSPEEVTYQTLAIVYQELKPIETLLAQNKTTEAHQQLMHFMGDIKQKQTELIEQITPF